jgi:outer membrane biosynthesis protein TonB
MALATHRRSISATLFAFLSLMTACSHRPDDAITTEIKAKMFSEPVLKSAGVDVATKDGIVTLTGEVRGDSARQAARRIASETKGVKQVIDSTTAVPPPPAVAQAVIAPPRPEPKPQRALQSAPKPAPKEQTSPTPAPAAALASSSEPGPMPSVPAPETPAATAAPPPAPPAPPASPITVTVPEGTVVTVRTVDSIDSATASTGQSFRGSLDDAVVVGEMVVLPKGLNAKLKLVQASSAGKFSGKSELTVSLDSVTYQGKTYEFSTSDVQEKGSSRGKRSAAVIGGGAALGALIGGLAGGGKGAAIGAGVGAGGGTAVQAMTKGQQVKIPSETRLDFTLHTPVDVTYIPGSKPPHPASSSAPRDSSEPTEPQK